ncbi:phospholipase [Fusarium circinatum]|uniref:Phospholipase n=1 Tax=Fusarium circinatum TaxID=48490 RepID=A0A8H5WRX9_FUSCI|nr:phospholipase [Fusarium circinatum]
MNAPTTPQEAASEDGTANTSRNNPLSTDKAIENLISTFNELNSNSIDELRDEPSPLEFMRYVARNTPFVIRGGASSWKACQDWNSAYLLSVMKGQSVNVAVTPYGNADMPTVPPGEESLVFAKPHYEDQPFEELLEYVARQGADPDFPPDAEVRYAQTQNDNLREEYITLFSDVQKDIPFARIALDKSPDAVNLWIGRKHFVLLPSLCHSCVNEQPLRPATYRRGENGMELKMDPDDEAVPFAIWDPDKPEQNATKFSHLARPLRVTLNPGDMLYLPSMWYHKVLQSCAEEDEGFVLAVNYWYQTTCF